MKNFEQANEREIIVGNEIRKAHDKIHAAMGQEFYDDYTTLLWEKTVGVLRRCEIDSRLNIASMIIEVRKNRPDCRNCNHYSVKPHLSVECGHCIWMDNINDSRFSPTTEQGKGE